MKEQTRLQRGNVITRIAQDERHGTVLDEIVAENCTIHVEVMTDQSVSLVVYGRKETVWYAIGTKRARVEIFEQGREKAKR